MGFSLSQTVVPFKIEAVYQGSGHGYNPFPPLLKEFFEPRTTDSEGDYVDPIFPIPVGNWTFISDEFKYKTIYASKLSAGEYTVYLVNETSHPGSDEWVLSVFSEDLNSLETFCEDFALHGTITTNVPVATF